MRQFDTAVLSAGLLVWLLHMTATSAQNSVCQSLAPSPSLTMFVDALPIPSSITLTNATLTIGAYKITQKLHRDLPATTLYAYGTSSSDARYPSHTLEARRNQPAHIYWENHIPDAQHFLPVDRTIMWANPPHGGVPTVVHLHGAETQSFYDGHPDAWFTPFGDYGRKYTTQNYTYPNAQKPTMLWYHDHVVGITRLNVLAGMTGLYMLRSSEDQTLTNLFTPGVYEIPLVLKDLQFWTNGSINFPNVGDNPDIHPQWCPEYFGDTILVNGKVWPTFNITARFYRFRFLNGANARFFNISMSDSSLSFIKIGTDGGYLPSSSRPGVIGCPQTVKSLLIAPAERYDVLVDFSGLTPGSVVYLNNSAVAPFPSGTLDPLQTSVMQLRVVPALNPGPSKRDVMNAVQLVCNGSSPFTNYTGSLHRKLTLQEFDNTNNNNAPIVSTLGNKTWTDPVTETPKEGAVEVWELINLTPDAHPIHVHLIQFQVKNQQPFSVDSYNNGTCNITIAYGQNGTCFTGPAIGPAIYHTGLKDTAIVLPNYVTRYGMHFVTATGEPFPFDPTVGPGYVWHCHILDHEDNDMMRPYIVTH